MYDSSRSAQVCRETIGDPNDVVGNCQVQIWIDLETNFLVKSSYLVETTQEDDSLAQLEQHHVFASYNEDVMVEPPPWLNMEPNSRAVFPKPTLTKPSSTNSATALPAPTRKSYSNPRATGFYLSAGIDWMSC